MFFFIINLIKRSIGVIVRFFNYIKYRFFLFDLKFKIIVWVINTINKIRSFKKNNKFYNKCFKDGDLTDYGLFFFITFFFICLFFSDLILYIIIKIFFSIWYVCYISYRFLIDVIIYKLVYCIAYSVFYIYYNIYIPLKPLVYNLCPYIFDVIKVVWDFICSIFKD